MVYAGGLGKSVDAGAGSGARAHAGHPGGPGRFTPWGENLLLDFLGGLPPLVGFHPMADPPG